MKRTIWILLLIVMACNHITTGDKLSNADISRIQRIGILDKDEQIIKFYSEFKNSVAGNFFTNKRLGKYWLDENDKTKNQIFSAFYQDIIAIDTVYYAGATYSPYMNVTSKDGSSFKVCFDGEKNELRRTFIDVITIWKEHHPENNKLNVVAGQPKKEFQNCNFDNFIVDMKTPKLAKDIYLYNNWNLANDYKALALLDSLNARDEFSRPFYFKVITKSHKKADGAYAEALGLAGKEYVENNTREFISYFDSKNCFNDNDLTTWAKIAILEFSIREEGEYEKPIIEDYIKKLKSNCNNCTLSQKENLDKFGLILKKEWKKFLKTTD